MLSNRRRQGQSRGVSVAPEVDHITAGAQVRRALDDRGFETAALSRKASVGPAIPEPEIRSDLEDMRVAYQSGLSELRSRQGERAKRRSLPLPPAQESELLEQVHVLLVLEQCAVQGRDQLFRLALAQGFGGDVLIEQKLEPVEQFRSGRLLFQSGRLAQGEERAHGLFYQLGLDRRIVRFDDPAHRLDIGKANVVKEAAAQEGVGQLLLVVGRDDDDRPQARLDRLSGLVDVKLHLVELEQEIVGELDVRLVDLVDQEHWTNGRGERLPQLAAANIVGDLG